jgi:transposase
MNFVPVKSVAQQADAMVLSVRELLVKQHTQLVNALRGHAAEFGLIVAKGTWHVAALLERIAEDPAMRRRRRCSWHSVSRSPRCTRGWLSWIAR